MNSEQGKKSTYSNKIKNNKDEKSEASVFNTLVFGLSFLIIFSLMLALKPAEANSANSRIKDIVNIEGIRDNMLVGYGLVVGLKGTGDKLNNTAFTEQSLISFLSRLGINSAGESLKTKNVAAVMVTATLPAFSRNGNRINVSVSTIGDAQSLQGGVLLATPLLGADGKVYAVAQGSILTEGFEAGGEGAVISKGVPTSGFVPNGAIVEREIHYDINKKDKIGLALINPDITTATGIAKVINQKIGQDIAEATDPGTVIVKVPHQYKNTVISLLYDIERLTVGTDNVARIIIDEASGTIVMGENVKIDRVAVAQGNLVVKVTQTPVIAQPGAFAPEGAETVVAEITDVEVTEDSDKKMTVFEGGAKLDELVNGLNALGVGPRDLISILQTIKLAGAIQADIETR